MALQGVGIGALDGQYAALQDGGIGATYEHY